MTEQELVENLKMLFDQASEADEHEDCPPWDEQLSGCEVEDFRERGVLTNNQGLVLQLQDGSEYQITVVQSKPART